MENQTPALPANQAPPAAKAARKAPKKVTKVTKSKPSADGKIALKTICSQLKMEPKAARRKLRKAGLSFHESRDRWTFTTAQAERARELLKA